MIMYYNELTKQVVPIADDGTVIHKNDSKIVTAQTFTGVVSGASPATMPFEACSGFRSLHVMLKASRPATMKVQWSFDGIDVDGEEQIFDNDTDRVPKSVKIPAPYFKLIPTNNDVSAQDITIKSYLVA